MTKPIFHSLVGIGIAAAGCGGSGLGAEVRSDIEARMTSAKPALDSCYKTALDSNRKLKGMVTIALIAEASTGQFKNVEIQRDEIQDPGVRNCIVTEIGKLKLEKPTSANVLFDYSLRFSPTN